MGLNIGKILRGGTINMIKGATSKGAKGILLGKDGRPLNNSLDDNAGVRGLNEDAAFQNDPSVQAGLNKAYESGDLSSILNGANGGANARAAVMDPRLGSRLASQQVQDDPLSSGYFGKGGLSDRMLDEEKELASRGYSMQPEDHEAFGQASDEIARMSGQEEASLGQALASRGLASGPNGAAAVGFSGLQGNKFERLAGAQRQIASDRMKSNQERLSAVRNQSMQLGEQGQQALSNQFDRNMKGIQERRAGNAASAEVGIHQQNQTNESEMFKEKTKKPGAIAGILGGLGSMVGKKLGSEQGGGMIGSSLGKAISK